MEMPRTVPHTHGIQPLPLIRLSWLGGCAALASVVLWTIVARDSHESLAVPSSWALLPAVEQPIAATLFPTIVYVVDSADGAELAAANEAIAATMGSPADWQVVMVAGDASPALDALHGTDWMFRLAGEAGVRVIDLTAL